MNIEDIKFMKHYVTDGVNKARVFYSLGEIFNDVKMGINGGTRKCITLYAKDYGDSKPLRNIFEDKYQNDTDINTDYFEEGKVRIFPEDALYNLALERCK